MVQNIYDKQFPNVWSKWAVLNGLEDLRTFDMHLRSQFQQYRIFFTFEAPGYINIYIYVYMYMLYVYMYMLYVYIYIFMYSLVEVLERYIVW